MKNRQPKPPVHSIIHVQLIGKRNAIYDQLGMQPVIILFKRHFDDLVFLQSLFDITLCDVFQFVTSIPASPFDVPDDCSFGFFIGASSIKHRLGAYIVYNEYCFHLSFLSCGVVWKKV